MSEHDLTRQSEETLASTEPAKPNAVEAPPAPSERALPPQEVRRDGQIEHPRVLYQRDEAPLAGLFAVMAFALCVVLALYIAAWWFFQDRERDERRAEQSLLPAALQPGDRLPVEPRLEQLDRVAEIETPNVNRRQTADEKLLNSFGPTDEPGFIHVPIDRAMDFLVGRLPVRQARPAEHAHDQGLVDAGDSNSGRMFRGNP
ncbi:MAG TPA: hypothetical protein VHY91_08865 [Pirellulales bacterium]|jgi:hypothetical protein|nr:hypothetical protein [Pirellulales bacterium]